MDRRVAFKALQSLHYCIVAYESSTRRRTNRPTHLPQDMISRLQYTYVPVTRFLFCIDGKEAVGPARKW